MSSVKWYCLARKYGNRRYAVRMVLAMLTVPYPEGDLE